MNTKIKTDKELEFIQLRAQGLSIRDCQSKLGIGCEVALTWNRDLRLEIDKLKAVENEKLKIEILKLRKEQITKLSEEHLRVFEEIQKRDLKDVSTKDLYKIFEILDKKLQENIPRCEYKKETDFSDPDFLSKPVIICTL